MIFEDFDTRVAANQLKLIFDIEAVFKRRGRAVARFDNAAELLFDPSPLHAQEKMYEVLGSRLTRCVVAAVANACGPRTHEEIRAVCTNLTDDNVQAGLSKAIEAGLIVNEDGRYRAVRDVGFGHTFEWFVSAVCEVELASLAYWGVTVEGLTGDYDVVAIRESQIGYIECKTGPLRNITREEVGSFLDRERVLAPHFSIFLVEGVSRERLEALVEHALSYASEYEFEIPGVMTTGVSLDRENYEHFVRLIPINTFFVAADGKLVPRLKEIYQFLTLVCDRPLLTENASAKRLFQQGDTTAAPGT